MFNRSPYSNPNNSGPPFTQNFRNQSPNYPSPRFYQQNVPHHSTPINYNGHAQGFHQSPTYNQRMTPNGGNVRSRLSFSNQSRSPSSSGSNTSVPNNRSMNNSASLSEDNFDPNQFYNSSMVEDPWKNCEEKIIDCTKESMIIALPADYTDIPSDIDELSGNESFIDSTAASTSLDVEHESKQEIQLESRSRLENDVDVNSRLEDEPESDSGSCAKVDSVAADVMRTTDKSESVEEESGIVVNSSDSVVDKTV